MSDRPALACLVFDLEERAMRVLVLSLAHLVPVAGTRMMPAV